MNIFERGNDWLNSRLKTGGSSTIVLTDREGNSGSLEATIGKQLVGIKSIDTTDTRASDKDFTILRADLITADLGEPGDGWTVGYGGNTYRVFETEESDAFDGRLMLRTVRTA